MSEFRCANCNEVFLKGGSDEAAENRWVAEFPLESREDRIIICNDCHRKLMLFRNTSLHLP
jgi:DNA-directed RNA polymerase subunit RPC12/RpoP